MDPAFVTASSSPLGKDEVERFSRQMMVEGIGAEGMAKIRQAKVSCIGAGGLGSTIALYLAAAGVGKLTLVDFDEVEVSNLHRQVIHTTANVGKRKVESAREACLAIYPEADIRAIPEALSVSKAVRILEGSDVIVDGTDNVAARYLINDAAVHLQIPLVSGSAMRWEGQLTVYGYAGGPCYRCLFPQPPPPAAVGSCNDAGVMGPVPGMIGCLQALETLKLLTGAGELLSGRMLLFDGLRMTMRTVKLRPRQASGCPTCSDAAVRDRDTNNVSLAELAKVRPEYVPIDGCSVGGEVYSRSLLPSSAHCSAKSFAQAWKHLHEERGTDSSKLLCIDVRVPIQFGMCHLPGSVSLPLPEMQKWERDGDVLGKVGAFIHDHLSDHTDSPVTPGTAGTDAGASIEPTLPVTLFLLCRRGVASVQATRLLLDAANALEHPRCDAPTATTASVARKDDNEIVLPLSSGGRLRARLCNVNGGLNAYHKDVDAKFPFY